MDTDLAAAVRSSGLGELAWVDPDGRPAAMPVVALARGSRPVVALTADRVGLARRVARAGRVALVLRDPRGAGRSFTPLALAGAVELQVDADGEMFRAELLEQELRRYPPSRVLADSPLLCREHWWYLPRLVLEVVDPVLLPAPAPREGEADHLLVTARDGIPVVTTVRAPVAGTDLDDDPLRLQRTGGAHAGPGPALLLAQDASVPDLERWEAWSWEGTVGAETDGALSLDVSRAPEATGLPPTPSLLQRWRSQRAFERGCRAGIAALT
jgi:hypothetical protein